MKTPTLTETLPAPLAPWEKGTIVFLLVTWIGGAFLIFGDLSERRGSAQATEARRAREIALARAEGARLVRESETVVRLLNEAASVPSVAATTARPIPLDESTAARTAALAHVADLLGEGVLATTASRVVVGRPSVIPDNLPAYAIDAQGRLAPEFGQLFGLSESEVGHLQLIVTGIKQRAEDLVLSHTTLRPNEEGFELEFRPPDGVDAFRESALAPLQSYLGEERYRLFASLNGERTADNGRATGGLDVLLGDLTGGARTITVARAPNGLRYTTTTANSRGSGTLGGNLAGLVSRLGPSVRLLPKEFLDSLPPGSGGGGGSIRF